MTSKVKIKMGHIEFEYEGDTQFDMEAIKGLFSHLENLLGVTPAAAFDAVDPTSPETRDNPGHDRGEGDLDFSPTTIASKLGANSGTDLAVAAAAYLQLVEKKSTFGRKEMLNTMKAATSHYKASMSSNLSKIFATLISSGRVNGLSNGKYSLSAGEQAALRGRLAA